MEWLPHILQSLSLFGIFRFLAEATTTDVVLLFLCSKPIFLIGCVGAALRGRIDADRLPPADAEASPTFLLDSDAGGSRRHE